MKKSKDKTLQQMFELIVSVTPQALKEHKLTEVFLVNNAEHQGQQFSITGIM